MRASNRTTDVPPSPAPEPGPVSGSVPEAGVGHPLEPGRPGRSTYVEPPGGMLDLSCTHPVSEVAYRHRAQVAGRVRSLRVRPWGEVLTFELVLADATGAITVAFLGRRAIAGIELGSWITVEGMVGQREGKLVILNPAYDLREPGDRM